MPEEIEMNRRQAVTLTPGLPFDPLREHLYTPEELFEGFSVGDRSSYGRCADISILRYFVRFGTHRIRETESSTLEALHDNAISLAIRAFLKRKTVVAVMGGHDLSRGTRAYSDIAHFAYELASAGVVIVTGGGPGAMEAAHLGAYFSLQSPRQLTMALHTLGNQKPQHLPVHVANLVEPPDGTVDGRIAKAVHRWFTPAFQIATRVRRIRRGQSLGIPTWLYGYEPSTPFATHIGKYFQNSLREDGLITVGTSGILYTEGSAGTVQEIFQDAARNYYYEFRPMVFLSTPAPAGQHYWERTFPVRPLIEALLGRKKDFRKVLFTDDWREAAAFFQQWTARRWSYSWCLADDA